MLSFAAAEVAAARKEERARCAKVCRDRAVLRFIDHGTVEDDTGASYYEGNRADEYETRDEEDESCAEGIEKLEDA
jgi:hypothetical protein